MKPASILSPAERDERNRLEAVVTSGIKNFVEVGSALLTISEKRLYRETHGSFEPYCQEKWGMSARQAYRLCEAATVVKSLPADCDQLVANESQARELARVPADQRAEVLERAGGKPTAKAIRQAARVPLEQASEPTSRPDPSPALRGIDTDKLDGGKFTPNESNLVELALRTRDDMDAIVDCVKGHYCDIQALSDVLKTLGETRAAIVAYQMEIKKAK